jgi:xylulose-5-phosphate/fructose-6-phosphate phosphoketolase
MSIDVVKKKVHLHSNGREPLSAKGTLPPELLRKIDAYWRAANYLSVGQIYLYDNPLLKAPLTLAHVKPLVVGHWGTTPGQNFIYVHLNRVIKKYDLNMLYIAGPGHGGPAIVGNVYLEGTWSEIYTNVTQDEAGLKKLFKQFSFPGGISSHVAPTTPGSIHEGGDQQPDRPGPHRARGTGAVLPRLRLDAAVR